MRRRPQREDAGVPWRAARGVVVQEREDVLAGTEELREPAGPRVERPAAVAPVRARTALVEAQVAPVRGPPEGGPQAGAVDQAPGGAAALQGAPHLRDHPRAVPRLDGDADAGGE